MVYILFPMEPTRYHGNRSLPPPSGPVPGSQETTGQQLSSVLCTGDQPRHSPSCPLGTDPLPRPSRSGQHGPPGKIHWEPPPPPMAQTLPPFEEKGPPARGCCPPLNGFPTGPWRACAPSSQLSAPPCWILPWSTRSEYLAPTESAMSGPTHRRMESHGPRGGEISVPPVSQASSLYGP